MTALYSIGFPEVATTPTATATVGVFTTVAVALKYANGGNRVFFNAAVTITTNGTAAGAVKVPLPFTPLEITSISGVETGVTGLSLAAYVHTDGNAYIRLYDGTYPGAGGRVLSIAGHYRI